MKKLISFVISLVMITVFAVPSVGCGGGSKKIKLYFDGGGGSGNYNSTLSMVASSANPYPYNTLEKLAKEWSDKNDKYEIVINRNSLNGMRSAITGLLDAGTAPDMLYQAGGVINDDLGKGWYVDLTPYFDTPNPYAEGNQKWGDIYNKEELDGTRASDGKIYYACLDKVTVGLMYNTEILKAAGITEIPQTFSQFLTCLEILKQAKAAGTINAEVYLHQGFWMEIYLNTSVYASKVKEFDEDGNGMVSGYELAKAYKAGKWSYEDEEFKNYLQLCYKKASYYPSNYLAYDTAAKFSKGQLAITDGLGNNMNIAYRGLKDKLKISGYPALDKAASEYGGYTCVRGSAGLSTAYWVTNSAVNKGEGAVEACVDFLKFLTAPKNNARMVNDLGFALPLNVADNTTAIFNDLSAQYEEDMKNPDSVMWSSINLFNSFGQKFYDTYEKGMGEFYGKNHNGEIDYITGLLGGDVEETINSMAKKYGWTF